MQISYIKIIYYKKINYQNNKYKKTPTNKGALFA